MRCLRPTPRPRPPSSHSLRCINFQVSKQAARGEAGGSPHGTPPAPGKGVWETRWCCGVLTPVLMCAHYMYDLPQVSVTKTSMLSAYVRKGTMHSSLFPTSPPPAAEGF
ncbi:unnamed protein product [Pipistrellus nathusii]|uniref:Uncharacterized protein n=1 Tax=Pipistrellus nathusii TaxID=59473 RepID=A0ABN9ZA58_PIPNA